MKKIDKDRILSLVKSPQFYGFFIATAILAIIALAFFYPADIEGLSLKQADMQQGAANGQEGLVFQQQTGEKALWTNSLFSGMPTFQISPEYESDSLFSWINSVYGLGLPSPANLLFMMMFGFLILLFVMKMRWYFALLGAIAWGFSSYFVIIIGAGHIWKFLALSYVPPTIAGLILCYRGRYFCGAAMTALFAMLQLHSNHPQMSYYFGLVMGVMAVCYLVSLLKEKKFKQWLLGSVALLVAGGLAIGANAPSLYNTYEYQKETKRSQSELTPLPSADKDGQAKADAPKPTGGMPYEQIVGWSYGGTESLSLLIPDIKGGASAKPVAGQMTSKSLAQLDGAKEALDKPGGELLNYFTQYFNDSEGTNGPVYVGAIILALFLMGCFIVKGPLKWSLLIMTVLSVLLALGSNFSALTDFMIYNFPLYNKFRAVESILVIAEFCIPLLAVMCLWQIFRSQKAWHQYKTAFIGVFGFLCLVCLMFVCFPSLSGSAITQNDQYYAMMYQQQLSQYLASQPGMTQALYDQYMYSCSLDNPELVSSIESLRYGMVRSDAFRSLIFLLLGGACVFFLMRDKGRKWLPVAGVTVLTLLDLYGVDKRYVSQESFCDAEASAAPMVASDAIDKGILQDTTMSYRVLDIPGFDLPNRSYFHKMIGGYHAAKLNRYEDLIQRRIKPMLSVGYKPEYRNISDSLLAEYDAESQEALLQLQANYRVLDMLNAKYIITGDKDAPVIINSRALGNAWLVDSVKYVDGADAEMAALSEINVGEEAVADTKFRDVIGMDTSPAAPGDTIYMTSYTPNTLTYKAKVTSPTLAVFSEVYFPWGWKAFIDDKPAKLARVNYVLRAMTIPAGSHDIRMTFDPDSIHTTSTIAYICVTFIYMLVIFALFVAYGRRFLAPGKKDN